MSERLFLHVGLPKSGTTYLQDVLAENKARLADRAGLLYPGGDWDDQVFAARDVLGAHPGGYISPEVEGAWPRLLEEIRSWEGDAVVSMEWLGSARPNQARRLVTESAPARVEVIVTVRDLLRTVPAAWQEQLMQNQNEWTWAEFLRSVSSDDPRGTAAGNLFWAQQDIGRVLAVWRDVLPADQIHVVTVPARGAAATELWNRFARVLGIDGPAYDASGRGGNESLGLQSAELMRRVNTASRVSGVDFPTYDDLLKKVFAKRGLSRRRDREDPVRIPAEFHEWIDDRSAQLVQAIESSGVDVVGDLADLRPAPPSGYAGQPVGSDDVPVTADDMLNAALEGLVFLVRDVRPELFDLREQNEQLIAELEATRRRLADLESGGAAVVASRPGIRGVLISASQRSSALMMLRRGYWRLVNTGRALAGR